MTFNANIPLSTDSPSQSQAQLLANFASLNTVFAVDHLAFNAVDAGEHKQVTFNNIIGDPGLGNPKASLYTKTVAGDSELFYENFDVAGAANLIRQMTNLTITNVANTGTAGGNISHIDTPWGIRLLWGTTNSFSGTLTVIATAGTTVLNYQLTAQVSTGVRNPINGGTLAGTTLTIKTIDNVPVRYFMIGTY